MTNKTMAALNNFEMNAQVSLDDVVNVFISRFETERHNRFEELQAQLKENGQKLKALELEAMAKIKEDFVHADEVIHRAFMFETHQSYGEVKILWPSSEITFEIKHVTKPINHAKLSGYYDTTESKNSFTVKVNLHEHFAAAYKRIIDEGQVLRDELMSVNQQLQQVDRKARQVKGFIAERKLEQLGMTELLENPELLQLVQLN